MSTAVETGTGGEGLPAPSISTVAGTGEAGFSGDEGFALSARLNHPYGVAVDRAGTLYLSEFSNHRIRKVASDGKVGTYAGTGGAGGGGDGGPAVSAELNCPREVALGPSGALYIADAGNHRVRKVAADGTISTFAGTGAAGFSGDGGRATAAQLDRPYGVALDSVGAVYIAEYNSHRVRKVAVDGTISTIAGTGVPGFAGDGGPAVSAQLNHPYAVAVDSEGVVYIADADNHRVRRVVADGTISTVAGTGAAGFGGDDGPAASAELNTPVAVAVDGSGGLYVSDQYNHRVRRVVADGTISTVAGTGAAGFGGDDGPAASAQLNNPFGLAVDRAGGLYIADHVNDRVRRIEPSKVVVLPVSGTVVSWANVRSRLRMAVQRESLRDGAEVHQSLASSRSSQRWRLVSAGQDEGEALYRFENVRSGKVLEVLEAQQMAGAVVAQRAYEGDDAHHQHWRLIPVDSATDGPQVFEIANRHSGLLLRVDTNARAAIKQHEAEGDHRERQWQLLPV
ncbi:NHL domain-containing protein [Streptomyces varsoviensis]|uniref:NHL repeat-containing protein n=1 Tax=Streptomyces varsoviensis TaxID=67373 RepID=A0ABR5IV71_9ACTN|nr:RICIN domain-containing protein [Streptomyces varsoviensis]KOG76088.1 NHL repeat-containing protein [Streptomyces varsoviensis]